MTFNILMTITVSKNNHAYLFTINFHYIHKVALFKQAVVSTLQYYASMHTTHVGSTWTTSLQHLPYLIWTQVQSYLKADMAMFALSPQPIPQYVDGWFCICLKHFSVLVSFTLDNLVKHGSLIVWLSTVTQVYVKPTSISAFLYLFLPMDSENDLVFFIY